MKIKLSKSQWEGIGKKAGWAEEFSKTPTDVHAVTPTTQKDEEYYWEEIDFHFNRFNNLLLSLGRIKEEPNYSTDITQYTAKIKDVLKEMANEINEIESFKQLISKLSS